MTDEHIDLINSATPEELQDMVVAGAFMALYEARRHVAEGREGAVKELRSVTAELLGMFTRAAERGETPDARLIEFVAGQYRAVENGTDARTAFPKDDYKPPGPREERDIQIAAEVEILRLPERGKAKKPEAIAKVAARWADKGLSKSNVKRIYEKYKLEAEFRAQQSRGMQIAKEVWLVRGKSGIAMSLNDALAHVGKKYPDLTPEWLAYLYQRYEPWGRSLAFKE